MLDRTGLDQDGVGDDQRVGDIQTGQFDRQLLHGTLAGQQFVGDLECSNAHQQALLCVVLLDGVDLY